MAAFTCYFDASGAPDQGKALSVAGFVAKADQWVHFVRNWTDALNAYGVSELHMKNYAHSAKEYASWKGDEAKRRRFLERLINIIKTRCSHSFVCSIMLKDFRLVDEQYCLGERFKPYALAGSNAIMHVRDWAMKSNINEKDIGYCFEDGDKDRGELRRHVKQEHGIVIEFMTKKEGIAFQAADLLAYEQRLANQKIFDIGVGMLEMADLRRPLQALENIPHGSDGEHWGIYAKSELERFCIGNNIPLRSTPARQTP
jgi:hypothetical protein